jgi:hypothetical protein
VTEITPLLPQHEDATELARIQKGRGEINAMIQQHKRNLGGLTLSLSGL